MDRRGHDRGIYPAGIVGRAIEPFMGVQVLVLAGPVRWALPIWVLFGFFGTSGIIAYAALSQQFPVQLSGRVTTAVNLLVFIAAFVGQWAIGAIIGLWPVGAEGNYSLAGYRSGFAVMLGAQTLTLGWFFIANRIIKGRD